MNRIKIHNGGLILLLGVLLFSNCTRKSQLIYMQEIAVNDTSEVFDNKPLSYQIQAQDILYIKVFTVDPEVSELFNVGSEQSQQMYQNETSLFINGYVVNDSGYIDLPVIGDVKVAGLTVTEAKEEVEKLSIKYLKNASITLKLISFKFTVIGEVNKPGVFRNFNNQLTVLEAIGMAGDISPYGNRKEVLVVRPTRAGTITYRLDLTDKNILASPAFFLLPNDLVYVEPIRSKIFELNLPTISLALSSVSTIILILNYVRLNN